MLLALSDYLKKSIIFAPDHLEEVSLMRNGSHNAILRLAVIICSSVRLGVSVVAVDLCWLSQCFPNANVSIRSYF